MAYAFDPTWAAELDRIHGIEATWDTTTIGRLEILGLGEGESFLEIGAGAGSIARWAASQVGPAGEVVATDLDTRFLQDLPPDISVLQHDIRSDSLPHDHFDVVHARLVLSHLAERDAVLARAARACRPGGHLVIEEFDESDTLGGSMRRPHVNSAWAEEALLQCWPAMGAFVATFGYDAAYGSRLAESLADCGLDQVQTAGNVAILHGATPQSAAYRTSLAFLGRAMTRNGLLTDEQLNPVLALLDDPDFAMATPVLVTAWGRRPHSPAPQPPIPQHS
ncbi:methyltransferase family protein [Streptomyces sp. TLI_235]|nr:class I SAM-dependent methyltransferase [Streptomyces sp. TLI_235]PBC69590.1 methyltransferase family protein [Streptomyces sp. TLI_235]